jgi:two-component system, response regulator YesN
MSQILIVDDNSNITSILEEMFSGLGCGVLTASNVPEALEVLNDHPVDLVVTDIVMPGPSGLSLISDVQKSYPRTKIIAISSGGENGAHLANYLQAAKSKGAVRCLPKPFKVMDLVVMVKEVLEEV